MKPNTLLKTFTWRIIATLTSIILAFLITGSIQVGVTIGIAETIIKTFLYFLHEKYWEKRNNQN
jgi:uncharacterized membrane protein